jgi:hypothetical protein
MRKGIGLKKSFERDYSMESAKNVILTEGHQIAYRLDRFYYATAVQTSAITTWIMSGAVLDSEAWGWFSIALVIAMVLFIVGPATLLLCLLSLQSFRTTITEKGLVYAASPLHCARMIDWSEIRKVTRTPVCYVIHTETHFAPVVILSLFFHKAPDSFLKSLQRHAPQESPIRRILNKERGS